MSRELAQRKEALAREREALDREKEALEQQAATSEILRAISSSPSDLQSVFDTIVRNFRALCGAAFAGVFTFDGKLVHDAGGLGFGPEQERARQAKYPVRVDDPSVVSARTIMARAPVHIDDTLTDPNYDPKRAATLGHRRIIGVPLLRDGVPLGAIVASWAEPGATPKRQEELLKTFADQAVIAIENVRLFNETKDALNRQTATADILRVIAGSPTEIQPVLTAVAERAAKLCEASNVHIRLIEGGRMPIVAQIGDIPVVPEAPAQLISARTAPGHAVLERKTIHIHDIEDPGVRARYSEAPFLRAGGTFRTLLVVPMIREGLAIGTISARRAEMRPFSDQQIKMVQMFADQAVIAIENVRLFNETKEALERQTATSEILKVISRTTFDLQPVLEIVLSNARQLCEADSGIIFRPDDEGNYRPVAFAAPIHERMRPTRELFERAPIRVDRSSATGRAIVEGVTVHVPDVMTDPEYRRLDIATVGDYRSILAVPMLRAGMPIGVLTLSRVGEAKPFSDKQIELVTVFADQAVIAIENVRLFREIQEKSAQLEVANKHKSDFLANMSHELRTPLNAIIGFSEAMMDKLFGELNEKQSEYLKDIHESGKHLLSLINDILDLSKIEAGHMELELSNFHLPTAVSNAVILVRERAMRHGIALGVDIDQRLGDFQADERKVKQILLNLLSNAVKFTPDGGRVDVSAKLDTDKVEIAVKDTGVGIAPEDQASLFEEFKQLGKDSTRKAEGTGLGLALTKRLVELHGGQILVDSAVGKGSTFRVLLPARV